MGRDLSWRISSKQDIIAILGMDELSEEDKLTVARARKVGCKKTKRDEWYLPVEWQVKWNHIYLENVTYYLYCNIYSVYIVYIRTCTMFEAKALESFLHLNWFEPFIHPLFYYVKRCNDFCRSLSSFKAQFFCDPARIAQLPRWCLRLDFWLKYLRGGWDFHRHPWRFRRLGNQNQWLRGGVVWHLCAMNALNF